MSTTVQPPVSLAMSLERNSLCHDSVHTAWGTLTLQTKPVTVFDAPVLSLPADFVFAVDVSASVSPTKMDFIFKAVTFLLDKLNENQTFSLIAFNHQVNILADLQPCTLGYKKTILSLVQQLQLSGATNLGGALLAGITLLNRRPDAARTRISNLLLVTEWSRSTKELLQSIDDVCLPAGCVLNTFGFGQDHDSKLLHTLSLKAQGLYYYLESADDIPATFGPCVDGILSTRAHQIDVHLFAQDGARLVTLATPFKIIENQIAKDYNVKVELLFAGETKSILFRLSLRAMKAAMNSHHLVSAEVNYINTLTGKSEILMANISVVRPTIRYNENIPIPLDQHINRFTTATTITEAIELSKKFEFMLAQNKITQRIEQISLSPSGKTAYCLELTRDLLECRKAMADVVSFQRGIHYAHACSSMLFLERPGGLTNKELMARTSQHKPEELLYKENFIGAVPTTT